jgi:septal ring factor EnvC (AmiA/AmiB activator)
MNIDGDFIFKAFLGILNMGVGLVAFFARDSFEGMKAALRELTAAVHAGEKETATLRANLTALKERVDRIERQLEQVREG